MAKNTHKRVSQVTQARWGTGEVKQQATVFADRKKRNDKRACRDRKLWD